MKRVPRARAREGRPGQVAPTVPRTAVDEAVAVALNHHKVGKFEEASRIYEEILRVKPGHADVLHLFGVLNAQMSKFDVAVPLLTKAVRKQPRNKGFLLDLANALRKSGQTDEAISIFRRAVGIDRKDANIRYNLGNALRDVGHLEKAAGAYQESLSINANNLAVQTNLGLVLFELGNSEGAVEALERAIEIDPSQPEPLSNLANVQQSLGELEEAEKNLRRAIEIEPNYASAYCNLGNVLQDMYRLVEAEKYYRKAIEIMPDYATAYSNLGNALQALSRYDEAVACGEKAIALDPRKDSHFSNLGMSYVARGENDKALECFRHAAVMRHGPPIVDLNNVGEECGGALDVSRTMVPFKLKHDAEQIRHLCSEGCLHNSMKEIAENYENILQSSVPNNAMQEPIKLNKQNWIAIGKTYNKPLHVPDVSALAGGTLDSGLDVRSIEANYISGKPKIVIVDSLLNEPALNRLWRFCLDATIWYQVKHGYLGAYLIDGFGTELTLQIASELKDKFPGIFRHHQLKQMWAYKYDSQLEGIKIHADFAAVNVNFWLTPDAANCDPVSGGLRIYKVKAPNEWSFRKYNTDVEAMESFVSTSGNEPLIVPYRQNRAVIFDSDLFHCTDNLDFKSGYENRRINVTMLFGDRHKQ